MTTAAVIALGFGLTSCGGNAAGERPGRAVQAFLESAQRAERDERALAEVHTMLCASSRRWLQTRAERASALAGRTFEPWEMLVPGRIRLRVEPSAATVIREQVQGSSATVTLVDRSGTRAEVPLVLEADGWKLALELAPGGEPDS
ncbi:MAG: hypothetical protein NZ898_10165 [Myxococcota bacterium]|nr:hypothetical protein [Myxococcota bacterium]MDW8363827.1 hypothetical protein [Myxococcales bacterium]